MALRSTGRSLVVEAQNSNFTCWFRYIVGELEDRKQKAPNPEREREKGMEMRVIPDTIRYMLGIEYCIHACQDPIVSLTLKIRDC